MLAGIELGGTKCIAVLADGRDIVERVRIETRHPDETLPALVRIVAGWQVRRVPIDALGIASFGPLDLARGRFTKTPKPGWSDVDLLGPFRALGLPLRLDTDVNGAALAEGRWGAAVGCRNHAYLTIGTGVGGGIVIDGTPLHGLMHPEMGHVRVPREAGDGFAGICPYHGDCLEGLASGLAIAARAGAPAETLAPEHPVWRRAGAEIAGLVTQLILIASPERVVIGGGVGSLPHLLDHVRTATGDLLNDYLVPCPRAALPALIVPPTLGGDAGPLGAILLAERARA